MSDSQTKGTNPSSAAMDPALAGLEPASVWRYFGDLARIPHETGNEAGVREYVKAIAAQRGYGCETNEVGDVLLRVNPGARGPVVAVQAHMDMVCVSKDGAPFDFAHEPIRLARDGDSIHAVGTSLGADNGIGVAYALALAEEIEGPFEVLLTVDEEKGFTGIEGVAPGWLRAKVLINLDSEEEGFLTIASAGARDFVVRIKGERRDPEGKFEPLEVTVDGLKGGHSGVEIHRGRTNALKVLGQVLAAADTLQGVVFSAQGGTAPNVIPSSCKAVVGLPEDRIKDFGRRLEELKRQLVSEEDPALRLESCATKESRKPLASKATKTLLSVLEQIPSGVIVASKRDPSQPFVSNNLAVAKELASGEVELTMMSRSPSVQELEGLEGRFRAIAEGCGASLEAGRMVPGWAPDYTSPLLALFQKKHQEQYGKEAKVLEIHAGLECGALQSKYPGMDLISVGPDITGVHSPEEKVSIGSACRTYELVRTVIRELHKAST